MWILLVQLIPSHPLVQSCLYVLGAPTTLPYDIQGDYNRFLSSIGEGGGPGAYLGVFLIHVLFWTLLLGVGRKVLGGTAKSSVES